MSPYHAYAGGPAFHVSQFLRRGGPGQEKAAAVSNVSTGGKTEEARQMTDDELSVTIESLCESKAEEFRMIGYEHVSGKEVWHCVSDKYNKQGLPALHQIVNDILSLKVTQFMNFMTISAYRGTHF
jgi:hypothetical protein